MTWYNLTQTCVCGHQKHSQRQVFGDFDGWDDEERLLKPSDCIDCLRTNCAAANEKVRVLTKALQRAKPIVGAAVAASTNESRPAREKVYNRIVEALAATSTPTEPKDEQT